MSQAIWLELEKLKRRIADLEDKFAPWFHTPEQAFNPKHFGKGRWQVVDFSDTKVGTEWLNRIEAQALADELNSSLGNSA